MRLRFKCSSQFCTLIIDRNKKNLIICSAKTNYQQIKIAWKNLFDPGQEVEQEAATDKMDDTQFESTIIVAFEKLGYQHLGTIW
jgi:hypothetical protein